MIYLIITNKITKDTIVKSIKTDSIRELYFWFKNSTKDLNDDYHYEIDKCELTTKEGVMCAKLKVI